MNDAIQARTLRVLFLTQIGGSIGVTVGVSVGALLAADMVGVGVSGLAQSAVVLGAALAAIPATRIARSRGRGPSLAAAYLVAALGGALTVTGAVTRQTALLFSGFFLFGGASAANMQARFAAVDLAPKALYGRHLSLIVWATTVGGVLGPNIASLSGRLLSGYRVPTLAAPFAISSAILALVALAIFLFLRPDPLLVAQKQNVVTAASAPKAGMGAALTAVMANPAARLGIVATAIGHVVMVGVMSMTPVHIRDGGHGAADTLRIVGIVLSIHVAGMYAFAPVMGALSDRIGRRNVVFVGIALLIAACAIAGTAGHGTTRLSLGLLCLGLGWSATMVSGSAMLSAAIATELKPSAQGLSDLVMGLAGASAGALSGLVVQMKGYPTLTLFAAIMTLPLALLAMTYRPPEAGAR